MKNIFYLILAIFVFSACSKSEIETWEAKPRAWFTASDPVVFTFYSQPAGTSEYIMELPITMAGTLSETDREVTIKALGGSPYNPGSRYEVVSAIIPAGEVTGSAKIKVYRTENLSTAADTLGFEIVSSDAFEAGLTDNLQSKIIVSSTLAKPAWWTGTQDWYIGYYSDEKLEIIYRLYGSDDLFNVNNAGWTKPEVTVAIYRLRTYCRENNPTYPDGTSITFNMYSL